MSISDREAWRRCLLTCDGLDFIPTKESAEWEDIKRTIATPISGDWRMSPSETIELALVAVASTLNVSAGGMDTLVGFMKAIPDVTANAHPMGCDRSTVTKCLSAATNKTYALIAHEASSMPREHLEINAKELQAQCGEIKYGNEKLYAWLEGSVPSMHYDLYALASDMCRRAERAFQYEHSQQSTPFLRSGGYWDSSRDGLLAAQQLALDLRRMEATDPFALLNLRETGTEAFYLPELLSDVDFLGYYMRRLKVVAVARDGLWGFIEPRNEIASEWCTFSSILSQKDSRRTATIGLDLVIVLRLPLWAKGKEAKIESMSIAVTGGDADLSKDLKVPALGTKDWDNNYHLGRQDATKQNGVR
ncbi:Fc.00g084980.m01.CDS01 [Cosmosporella sp. VM-42]